MRNQVIAFDEKEAYKLAEEYFIQSCGIKPEKEKFKKMLDMGMDVRKDGVAGIDIRAMVSSYGAEAFENHRVKVNGTELYCPAFEQIDSEKVKKIYIYALTAGECSFRDDDSIMKQLLADIWGTSYTDAGRYLLKEYIRKDLEKEYPEEMDHKFFLSDSFGPGFYGMNTSQIKEISGILNMRKLNIEVRESGIMLPLKSCSGLYFVVSDRDCLPHSDCRDCMGNTQGCHFCRFRNGQKGIQNERK